MTCNSALISGMTEVMRTFRSAVFQDQVDVNTVKHVERIFHGSRERVMPPPYLGDGCLQSGPNFVDPGGRAHDITESGVVQRLTLRGQRGGSNHRCARKLRPKPRACSSL